MSEQQSSGCSACDQLGQTPTPEHLAGVARFEARQQQLNKISLRHGVVGGEHCGAFEPQCDASWLLDEVAALRRQLSDDSAVADAAIAHHKARADKAEAENARLRDRVAALEAAGNLMAEAVEDAAEVGIGEDEMADLVLGAGQWRAALAGQERGGVTHAPTATVRVVELRCHCGRRVTVGADPWCVGCVQSAATCDCAALAGQEPAGEAS